MKKSPVTVILLFSCFMAGAQSIPMGEGFRKGRLDNGMTYYLYHNENPKGCADFYIAHNVGALQEEDNQNGLAHFLEHMAFNGLKHYPDKEMLNFLARDGVRFGYNVNAFTSRKETVYNISSVPLVRESFVDSVLTVLHDWSCDISCEQNALDAERGVIHEEWRLRDEPRYRMMCRQNELIYKNGKHPQRTVLGSMDVILNFKREDILDFYHKWYRPDLQAIIITGDFDTDKMERKVIAKFSDIRMPENAPQKPSSYMPPKQDGPIFADMTDPTIKYQAVKIIYKQPYPSDRCCEEYFRDLFSRQIVSTVLANRLSERCKNRNCPAHSAMCVTNASAPEFYISLLTLSPRGKSGMEAAFEMALTEVKRMLDHGISEQEFEVARLNVLQKMHLDRDLHPSDITTDQISKICYRNFLDGTPLLNPVENNCLQRRILNDICLEDIRDYPAKMFTESEVIYSNCINVKELHKAIPTDRMKEIVAGVNSTETGAEYLEYTPLDLNISTPAGKVIKKKKYDDIQEWTLSNGVKVLLRLKPEFKSDVHLALHAVFENGYRAFPEGNVAAGKYAASFFKRYCGFRGVGRQDLKNHPEMLGISTILEVKESYSGIDMRVSGKKQIENAFRVLNLQLSEPYFPSEKILEREKNSTLKILGRKKTDKEKFELESRRKYFGDNPWNTQVDSSAVNAVDLRFVEEQYRRCFSDIARMKLFLCTDASETDVEKYLCTYVATLRCGKKTKLSGDNELKPCFKKTCRVEECRPRVSEPLTDINYEFIWKCKRSASTHAAVQILDYILSNRYLNLIREERGGAYHVGFSTEYKTDPEKDLSSYVIFQTRPQLRVRLLQDVEDVMEKMCADGPSEEELETALKYFRKRNAEKKSRNENSAIAQLNELEAFVKYGTRYDIEYEDAVKDISADTIRSLARRIASDRRFIMIYTEE